MDPRQQTNPTSTRPELQYAHFCLENSTDKGAWKATVHGVAKSRTGLSNGAPTRTLVTTR